VKQSHAEDNRRKSFSKPGISAGAFGHHSCLTSSACRILDCHGRGIGATGHTDHTLGELGFGVSRLTAYNIVLSQ
jgi:hypothetical protein